MQPGVATVVPAPASAAGFTRLGYHLTGSVGVAVGDGCSGAWQADGTHCCHESRDNHRNSHDESGEDVERVAPILVSGQLPHRRAQLVEPLFICAALFTVCIMRAVTASSELHRLISRFLRH